MKRLDQINCACIFLWTKKKTDVLVVISPFLTSGEYEKFNLGNLKAMVYFLCMKATIASQEIK